ncbi:MAG: LysR family transcriptional regulator [Sneathiella sp.]
MAIKLEMLRCFVAVAQSGKLSDAAQKLGRTPSAVSMMLKQFEDHLGEALFESERKSRLTALGRFTLDEAVRELEHFDRAVLAITSFAKAKSGLVRVAAVPSVAGSLLPQAMQAFFTQYPDVSVDIRDMDSLGVHRELMKERIDIGIASNTGAGSEILCEELFSDAFGIVCRPDHPLASRKRPVNWKDLEQYPFIKNGLCEQISHPDFQHILTQSHVMVRNTTSLLALVRQGMGITVVPHLVTENWRREITFLPVADPAARRTIDILRRTDAALSPAAEMFRQEVRAATDKWREVEGF